MRSVQCCTGRCYCNLDDMSYGIKDVKSKVVDYASVRV